MSPQEEAFNFSQLFMIHFDLDLNRRSKIGKLVNTFGLIIATSSFLISASQIFFCVLTVQNLTDIYEGAMLYFQVIIKVAMMISKRDDLKELMDQIKGLWKMDKFGPEVEKVLEKSHKRMLNALKIFRVTIYSSILFSMTKSFLSNNYQLTVGRWVMPNGSYYETILIIEDLTAPYVVLTVFAFDSLFIVFCVQLGIQFKLLAFGFCSMEKTCNGDEKKIGKTLTCYIEYHNELLKIFSKLNRIYSLLLFSQLSTSLWILCFEMYVLSDSFLMDMGRFVNSLVYINNILIEIGIYFFAAQFLEEQTAELAQGVYGSGWELHGNAKNSKNVFTLMMRAQEMKPLRAAGVYRMDLTTFLAFLKTSFSVFTMMNAVKEKSRTN